MRGRLSATWNMDKASTATASVDDRSLPDCRSACRRSNKYCSVDRNGR